MGDEGRMRILGSACTLAAAAGTSIVAARAYGKSSMLGIISALVSLWLIFRSLRPWLRSVKSLRGRAIVITGCDYGFGASIALRLQQLGAIVFAGVLSDEAGRKLLQRMQNRNKSKTPSALEHNPGELRPIVLDVTKDQDVTAAMEAVRDAGFPLQGVVNNAGISAFGFAEMVDIKRYQQNMDVNHFGTVRICKAFLPLLRANQGRVVNMGSIGGRMPSAFGSAYLSTKAAMISFSECLRQEVHRFGVRVSLIEPGFFQTELLQRGSVNGATAAAAAKSEATSMYPSYEVKMQATAGAVQCAEWLNGGADGVERVVDCVVDALCNRCPLSRYVVGWDAHFIRHVVVFLPSWVVDWAQTLQG